MTKAGILRGKAFNPSPLSMMLAIGKQINFKLGPERQVEYGHLEAREKGVPGGTTLLKARREKRK